MNNMDATPDIVRLHEMVNAALDLQAALIGRDSDTIWNALNKVESVAQLLQSANRTRLPVNSSKDRAVAQLPAVTKEQQEAIQGLVTKIKRIQKTNRMIAGSFLKIINKTLSFVSTGGLSGTGSYDSDGSIQLRNSAVLLEQKV